MSRESIEIFCCYAHKDQNLLRELEFKLASLKRTHPIKLWYDANISPGMDWENEVHLHLNQTQIVLLLVSPDFMDSDYCYSVTKRAMERQKRDGTKVIPIIMRPVYWKSAPFGSLPAFPTEEKPVTTWNNRDEALLDVAEGIRKVVETMLSSSSTSTPDNFSTEETQAIKFFFCYARTDKEMRNRLDKHLRALRDSGQITTWFDREILPGANVLEEINLLPINKAEIVLPLISSDFINSGYLKGEEMEVAFYRKITNNLPIIPLMLRPTVWKGTEISELDKLPVDGIPVTRWHDHDEAFVNIVENLRIIVNKLLSLKQIPGQSAIHQKWMAIGWNTAGIIPATEELLCPDGVGRYQHFAKVETGFQGTIFWHPDPDIGVHFIQGNIREKWLALGWWENAPFYPTSDELQCNDGIGHYNHFRRVDFEPELYYLNDISVYSHPTSGSHEVHGAIRHHWLSLGAERYGYPTTDEKVCPDGFGRFSTFRNLTNNTEQILSWRQDTGVKMSPC